MAIRSFWLILITSLAPCFTFSASLGEQCQTNGDCVQAFSYCNINRCQCRENFIERQNRCTPQKYHCRFGYALLSTNGDAVQCDITSPINFPFYDQFGVRAYEKTWHLGKNNSGNLSIINPNGNNNQPKPTRQLPPYSMPGTQFFQSPYQPSGFNPSSQPWTNGFGVPMQPPMQQPYQPSYPFPTYPQQQSQQPFGPSYPSYPTPNSQIQYPYPSHNQLPMTPNVQWPNPSQESNSQMPQQQCYQQLDTCPKDYYCVTYFNNALSVAAGGRAIRLAGFCCPNPPVACPVGEPWSHSDAQCNNCPTETFFCYTDRKYGTKACCPKACNDGMTFYPDDGQCRPSARLGDQCDRDDQCGYSNSRCVTQTGRKRCGCAYGYVAVAQVCAVAQCLTTSQPPLVDMYGELVRCGALLGDSGRCPLNYLCDTRLGVCCNQFGYGIGAYPYPSQILPNGPTNIQPPNPYPIESAGTCPNFASPLADGSGVPVRCASTPPTCPSGYNCNGQSGVCCPSSSAAQCPYGFSATGQACTNLQNGCPPGSSCLPAASNGLTTSVATLCCRPSGQGLTNQQCPQGYYAGGGGRTCSRSDDCRQYGFAYCLNGACCVPNQ